jgi:hypothetical protein
MLQTVEFPIYGDFDKPTNPYGIVRVERDMSRRGSAAMLILWQHAELALDRIGDLAGPGNVAAIRTGAHRLFFRLAGAGCEENESCGG